MTFNNFVAQAVAGVSFPDRVKRYALETNWSNGEVVTRGTGANYGEDGFCRPGCTYSHILDYLYARVEETLIIGGGDTVVLTRDWKAKIAAVLVPRGLENDLTFRSALHAKLTTAIYKLFVELAADFMDGKAPDTTTCDAIQKVVKRISLLPAISIKVSLIN